MVMQAMRYGASNRFLKALLFGLLMLATAGLMITGGTNFGGGVGRNDVARIGDQTISLASFDRSLRGALSRIGIQPKDAFKLGFTEQFLAGEIRSRLLAEASRDNGIRIDRARIAGQIKKMIQPMVKEGQNEQDVLNAVLMNQGMNEGDLINSIEREMSGRFLSGAVLGGFADLSDDLVKDIYFNQNEKRDISYVIFLDKDAPQPAAPTDEDILKLYESTKSVYVIPETRVLQIIKVKDDDLKKTVKIEDEELKKNYEDNKDNYSSPATHTLEQALFDKEEEARKAYDSAKGGKSMEAASREATGKSLAYLGIAEIEDAQIAESLKPAVMAAKSGDLLKPVKSPLGWHLVRVTKIFAGGSKPFEDVKEEIRKDIYETRLADARYNLASQVDDHLASGGTLEELAKQVDVSIDSLPPVNQYGQNDKGEDALKAYEKTSMGILDAAFKLGEGETSPVSMMADGSFMAIHVKSIKPKTYKPFEEVSESLRNQWISDQRRMENRVRVTGYLEEMSAGKSINDIAAAHNAKVSELKDYSIKDAPPPPLGKESVSAVFDARIGEPALLEVENGTGIAVATDFSWPEKVTPEDEEFKKFKASFVKDAGNEALALYMEALNRKYKAAVNNALLKRAYDGSGQEN